MHRYRRILLVSTGGGDDEAVVRWALRLAAATGSRVDAVAVVPPLPRAAASWSARARVEPLDVLLSMHRRRRLVDLLAEHDDGPPGRTMLVDVVTGALAVEVPRLVRLRRHDLVLVAAPGAGREHELAALLRRCPAAVLVVRPGAPTRLRRILAAVAPGPDADELHRRLDRRILETAAALARMDDATLDVVHAWFAPGEDLLARTWGLRPDAVLGYVQDVHAQHARALRQLLALADLRDVPVELHLPKGPVARCIADRAAGGRCDLAVVGTVHRGGLAAILVGNTAEALLGAIPCSMLTVGPEGLRGTPFDERSPHRGHPWRDR